MAQKAELKGKLNLDSSGFRRGIAASKKSVSTFASTLKGSLLPVLGAAGAAGAMINFGRSALTTAKEIKTLAQVSGLGVVEFQKYADAAKTVNIDQSKLADIFKDTSDKMGDFMQANSGAMVDFFEQIAPAVGATKEEFIGLNGADSLQKYFNYLQKANIPHQDMVFYMEAIASDATMLIPLLQNGGEAFRTLGDGAAAAGRVMEEEVIEALVQAQDNIDRFMQKVTVLAGNIIGLVMPAVDAFKTLARAELEAEGAISKNNGRRKSTAVERRQNKLIEERAALLKKEAEDKAKADEKEAIADAIARRKELDAIEKKQKAEKKAREEKAAADKKLRAKEKAAREAAAAERKAEQDELRKIRLKEEAEEKRRQDALSERKLKLMRAEAAQDDAATHAAKMQLDLEERTQDILDSTNLSRAEAVKLAKQLQAAESGADTNQSGFITDRERRAEETKQRKLAQERRKRERKERSAEIGAQERQRQQDLDYRMTLREKHAGIDTKKAEVPATLDVETPDVPEIEVPATLDVETPDVPEAEVPAILDVETPEVPQVEVPAILDVDQSALDLDQRMDQRTIEVGKNISQGVDDTSKPVTTPSGVEASDTSTAESARLIETAVKTAANTKEILLEIQKNP